VELVVPIKILLGNQICFQPLQLDTFSIWLWTGMTTVSSSRYVNREYDRTYGVLELVFGVDIDHYSVPAKYFETQSRVLPFQGRNIHISVIAAFSVDTAEIDFVLFLSAISSTCAFILTSVRSLGIVKIQQFNCSCQTSAYRVSED
jgi:hypothetical protein